MGGGDGGLLKNLLELKNTRPKEIIMVELDELVLEACSKHLRTVCGPYLDLDRRVGENYTVLTEDALKFMELKIESNEEYDIIFGDLTDVPVETETESLQNNTNKFHSVSSTTQETWKFIKRIHQLALSLLKPESGRFYIHCNGLSVPLILKKYENLLSDLTITKNSILYSLQWTQTKSFVPSFMETWVFYQITLQKKVIK